MAIGVVVGCILRCVVGDMSVVGGVNIVGVESWNVRVLTELAAADSGLASVRRRLG